MGWSTDHFSERDHEGYVEAVELITGSTWEYRTINARDDESRARASKGLEVRHVQVACVCGWRSERFDAPPGTEWLPATTFFPTYMGDGSFWEDVCWDIWLREHAEPMIADLERRQGDGMGSPRRTLLSTARAHGRRPDMFPAPVARIGS